MGVIMADERQTWVHITAGQGPAECEWVVARVLALLQAEMRALGAQIEVLDATPSVQDPRAALASALLSIRSDDDAVTAALASWEGSVQWIGQSAYRPNHKRKNWFVGVEVLHAPTQESFDLSSLKVETMRASGAGGQHVNRRESAVRITHLPTGIVVTCQQERSQLLNRKMALSILAQRLNGLADAGAKAQAKALWMQHHQLERGNAVRVYEGAQFRLKRR